MRRQAVDVPWESAHGGRDNIGAPEGGETDTFVAGHHHDL